MCVIVLDLLQVWSCRARSKSTNGGGFENTELFSMEVFERNDETVGHVTFPFVVTKVQARSGSRSHRAFPETR